MQKHVRTLHRFPSVPDCGLAVARSGLARDQHVSRTHLPLSLGETPFGISKGRLEVFRLRRAHEASLQSLFFSSPPKQTPFKKTEWPPPEKASLTRVSFFLSFFSSKIVSQAVARLTTLDAAEQRRTIPLNFESGSDGGGFWTIDRSNGSCPWLFRTLSNVSIGREPFRDTSLRRESMWNSVECCNSVELWN